MIETDEAPVIIHDVDYSNLEARALASIQCEGTITATFELGSREYDRFMAVMAAGDRRQRRIINRMLRRVRESPQARWARRYHEACQRSQ